MIIVLIPWRDRNVQLRLQDSLKIHAVPPEGWSYANHALSVNERRYSHTYPLQPGCFSKLTAPHILHQMNENARHVFRFTRTQFCRLPMSDRALKID